jgi:hypothetical protein
MRRNAKINWHGGKHMRYTFPMLGYKLDKSWALWDFKLRLKESLVLQVFAQTYDTSTWAWIIFKCL